MMIDVFTDINLMDINTPFGMNEEDVKEFDILLKDILGDEYEGIEEVEEKSKEFGEREKRTPKKWTVEDLFKLTTNKSREELMEELGRTEMSIAMMQGDFLPEFNIFLNKEGYNMFEIDSDQVKEFIKRWKK